MAPRRTTVTVEVGAIGTDHTEVVDGLDAGDEVVLADLAQPLPSSSGAGSDDGGEEEGPILSGPMLRSPGGGAGPPG